MNKIPLPPYAPSLIESIRSIGYTFESALADLIDNSITAKATQISVNFSAFGQSFVCILDDGHGMESSDLTNAMRHGSKNPSAPRAADDLGRFGLGLKTASLSQCRRLTVVSLKDGILSARRWDLDIIIDEEEWVLLALDRDEIRSLPYVDQLEMQGVGTLVIWQDLDRIISGEQSVERALGEKMDLAREHLALVFHRYLSGEHGLKRLIMKINGLSVDPVDPFLLSHRATQTLPEENVYVEGHLIQIKPYILPHISKLKPEELAIAGGEEGLRKHQGFYVYRNKRLIVWGTWFRLVKQEELTKLARVRVDIPNTLDHFWTIDVKKSAAHPPEAVRRNLRRIVERIVEGSRRVYTFRGRKMTNERYTLTWDRLTGREGVFYRINRRHPLIESVTESMNPTQKESLELLLSMLESSIPIDAIYADVASDCKVNAGREGLYESLKQLAQHLLKAASVVGGAKEQLLENIQTLDPFCNYPELTIRILEELGDA